MTDYRWHSADNVYRMNCPKCGAQMEALEVDPPRSDVYLNAIQLCPAVGCRWIVPWIPARSFKAAGNPPKQTSEGTELG